MLSDVLYRASSAPKMPRTYTVPWRQKTRVPFGCRAEVQGSRHVRRLCENAGKMASFTRFHRAIVTGASIALPFGAAGGALRRSGSEEKSLWIEVNLLGRLRLAVHAGLRPAMHPYFRFLNVMEYRSPAVGGMLCSNSRRAMPVIR
jgi:hypothetical protein